MVPGSFAARAILGLFAVSTGRAENTSDVLVTSIEYTLRLMFTIRRDRHRPGHPGFAHARPYAAQSRQSEQQLKSKLDVPRWICLICNHPRRWRPDRRVR